VTRRTELTPRRIERNETESPLLKLPAEIREQIWSALLGDRVIHVSHRPRGHVFSDECDPEIQPGTHDSTCNCWFEKPVWRHGVCTSRHTELQRFETWKGYTKARAAAEEAKSPGKKTKCLDACHHSCLPKLVDIAHADDQQLEVLRLNILRTCRQLYVEANPLLWQTNTFSFDQGQDFKLFVQGRNTLPKRLLRKVRIDMRLCHLGPNPWGDALSMGIIRSLKGLRTLHAHIGYEFTNYMVDRWSLGDENQKTSIGGLLKLMVLPLETVTVMMTNEPLRPGYDAIIKAASELAFVEEVRSYLLNANGPEIWRKRWTFRNTYLYEKTDSDEEA